MINRNIDWMNIVEIKDVAYKDVNNMLQSGWRLIGVFQYAGTEGSPDGTFQVADAVYIMARFGVDAILEGKCYARRQNE